MFRFKEFLSSLGYKAVYPVRSQPTFRRNLSPLSPVSKNKSRKKKHQRKAGGKAGPEDEDNIPPKCRLTSNGLHGVTFQKMKLFITTGVRTSIPKCFTSSTFLLTQMLLYKPVHDLLVRDSISSVNVGQQISL
jgi:hypothetical protein